MGAGAPGARCRSGPSASTRSHTAKGHKYLTLVYQIEAGCTRLLWVGKERTIESFEQFFTLIGKELAPKIEFVCSDMWKPYLEVIREHCTNALNILDRFHIVAKMNEALDEVRAAEARRMVAGRLRAGAQEVPLVPAQAPGEPDRHSSASGCAICCATTCKSVRAYLLKEDFQQFWDYDSPTWAGKFLDEWCTPGHALAHRADEEIRPHPARPSRADAQLLPRQKGVLQRRRRGPEQQGQSHHEKILRLSHLPVTEIALYHALGKLPEPQLAHNFY